MPRIVRRVKSPQKINHFNPQNENSSKNNTLFLNHLKRYRHESKDAQNILVKKLIESQFKIKIQIYKDQLILIQVIFPNTQEGHFKT